MDKSISPYRTDESATTNARGTITAKSYFAGNVSLARLRFVFSRRREFPIDTKEIDYGDGSGRRLLSISATSYNRISRYFLEETAFLVKSSAYIINNVQRLDVPEHYFPL